MPYNLLGGQYLNPIIIGVVDEIESHGGIFETYPAVFLVILADCIIVSGHAEAEMAFVLAWGCSFRQVSSRRKPVLPSVR